MPSSRVNHEPFKNVTEGIQAIVTSVALIGGGMWALWRFILSREGVPRIQPELIIVFLHKQNGRWIVELVAVFENKGKARLMIKQFIFQLRYGLAEDAVDGERILVDDMFDLETELNFPPYSAARGTWLRNN